jgi:integrase
MDRNEMAALRTTSVNLLRRSVQVSESLYDVGGRIAFGPPKTKRSRRTLALPRFVCDEIAAHLADFGTGIDDLVFASPGGTALRPRNWRRRFWKPAVAFSVGEPLRFHDLRHSHAALLIREGQHAKVIQERLGHASIRTTLDTYGHLFDGLDEAAAEALDSAFRGVSVGLGG